jgi:sigma-B regulation protein RsbU (phosphoserine phosphatase)
VGGDYYDLLPLDDRHFGLVMADVSGKSLQAALYMAVTRALFLAKAAEYLSPQDAACQIHDLLMTSSDSDMFVTAFYGIIDQATREMRYVRAGHDLPIHFQAKTSQLSLLQAPGRFLGCLEGLMLNEARLDFLSGDALVCYSDGVTDALAPDGSLYGLERLMTVVANAADKSADGLAETIIAEVDSFRAGTPQPDDMTLLVMKVQ